MTPRPLSDFPNGSSVRVDSYCAGAGCRCRLCALGLTPGTTVTVESGGPCGCRLKVRGSDLVLGAGMAEKVLCRPAHES